MGLGVGVGMRLYRTIWDDSSVSEPVKESDRGARKQQTPLLIFTFLWREVREGGRQWMFKGCYCSLWRRPSDRGVAGPQYMLPAPRERFKNTRRSASRSDMEETGLWCLKATPR